jgi:hypothetical protein
LDYKGFYIVFTEFRAKNAGANDAYLDCGYTIGDSTAGAAGVQVAAGQVGRGISVTVVPAHTPGQRLRFACRDGGSTTWNLSRITLTTFRLGY